MENGVIETPKWLNRFSVSLCGDVMAVMDYVSRIRSSAEKLAEPGWQNPDFPKYAHNPVREECRFGVQCRQFGELDSLGKFKNMIKTGPNGPVFTCLCLSDQPKISLVMLLNQLWA